MPEIFDLNPAIIRPAKIKLWPDARTRSGQGSLTGRRQVIRSLGAIWRGTITTSRMQGEEEMQYLDGLQAALVGQFNFLRIPLVKADLSNVASPADPLVPVAASPAANEITFDDASMLNFGRRFSIDDFLYSVAGVTGNTVKIEPPLRQAITPSSEVFVTKPSILVRLAKDDTMVQERQFERFSDRTSIDIEEVFTRS